MARQVTKESISLFLNHVNCGVSNTTVSDDRLLLFGNCIAQFEGDDLFIRIHTLSRTTLERLNGFNLFGYNCHVKQVKGVAFVNGQLVTDYNKWIKIDKV